MKTNLSSWLKQNDISRIEFIVYCIAGACVASWVAVWAWTEIAIYLLDKGLL